MDTVRLTLGQAIVRFLMAQKIDDDGLILPLFSRACMQSSATAM